MDHFHNRIIAYEQTLPREEQVLTAFKVYQKQVRQQREADFELFWKGYQLSADDRERLIEKGKGHTRAFLDKHLFSAFYIVWFSLHIIIICEVVITLFRK